MLLISGMRKDQKARLKEYLESGKDAWVDRIERRQAMGRLGIEEEAIEVFNLVAPGRVLVENGRAITPEGEEILRRRADAYGTTGERWSAAPDSYAFARAKARRETLRAKYRGACVLCEREAPDRGAPKTDC